MQLGKRNHTPVSLLLIDLDHFKLVNDEHGHLVGDQVLVEFATLVQSRIRAYDLLFRFGGEEFLLVLPQTTRADALSLAESIRTLLESATLTHQIHLTCSIGVSEWQQPDESIESWLKSCDDALYSAKAAGRNRVAERVLDKDQGH